MHPLRVVWRSVDAFRSESSVPTWMYRVALNTAIAWTRKQHRHQRGKQPLEIIESLLTTSASDGHDPRNVGVKINRIKSTLAGKRAEEEES